MTIQNNISLKPFNTFSIDVLAKHFSNFTNSDELNELLSQNKEELLILGGGSNLLFTKNFDGLVLKNEIKGTEIIKEDNEHVYLKVGAGENWHSFVMHCIQRNLSGVENLALIPGNVGASPMQNIGAYGVEVKEVFHSLEALHIHDKHHVTFALNDCEFGYRESIFKKKNKGEFVILSVTFRLDKHPNFNTSYGAIKTELSKMDVHHLSAASIAQAVINIRSSKLPDPKIIGNAGSFFKNPEINTDQYEELKKHYPALVGYPLDNGHVKIAAGWMIENCGWKGYRKGDAGCHKDQALVLVNYGNAHGSEIYDLSQAIMQSVKNKFGISLEREVNIY